jgi:hypothetical protein
MSYSNNGKDDAAGKVECSLVHDRHLNGSMKSKPISPQSLMFTPANANA